MERSELDIFILTFVFNFVFLTREMDQNELDLVEEEDMEDLTSLRNLRLEGNRLRVVPTDALQPLVALEVL